MDAVRFVHHVQCLLSDAFFFDLPYGVLSKEVAPWDTPLSKEDLVAVVSSVRHLLQGPTHHVGFWCYWKQLGMLAEVLESEGYTGISTVYWYKDDQTVVGKETNLTFAVEIMVVASFRIGSNIPYYNFSQNPRERHNFIQSPGLHKYLQYLDKPSQPIVNPCQKPVAVAKWFFERYVRFGGTVVIAGTGAGGEVLSALECGLNVIGMDTDAEQLKVLAAHIDTFATRKAAEAAAAKKATAAKNLAKDLDEAAEKPEAADDAVYCQTCGAMKQPSDTELACAECQLPQCQSCGYARNAKKTAENRVLCGKCKGKKSGPIPAAPESGAEAQVEPPKAADEPVAPDQEKEQKDA